MEVCKVINYCEDYRDRLREYMHKRFPTYPDVYIDYCLNHSTDHVPSIIALNESGEIVGCHLYYCTKALINGKEIETQWGHDTYLDEEYRKILGVEFLLARKKIPSFGLGISEVNKKIRKLLKSVFIKGVYNYYAITPYIFLTPFQRVLGLKNKLVNIEAIRVKERSFRKIKTVNEIKIPNNGYWYKGFYELDFIRDKEFLEQRFLKNKVYDYSIYASEDSYFAVRIATYRGFPALMLSDFRYNPNDEKSADYLLKAFWKLAHSSRLGIVYFLSGDIYIDQLMKRKIKYKSDVGFISSYNISPYITYSISGGDSDDEFLRV